MKDKKFVCILNKRFKLVIFDIIFYFINLSDIHQITLYVQLSKFTIT